MSEYRCSQCERVYSHAEYMALDKQPLDPTDENPKKGSGYESVCECGAAFHSDKWQLDERVETPDGEEIRVSTVALLIPHGLNHNQWFETCIFHDTGSQVTDRYHTQEEAEEGHEERKERIKTGDFGEVSTGRRLEFK